MSTIPTKINPAFTRNDADGLACIGRSLHDLRGIRFEDGDGGNAPGGGDDAAAEAALAQAIADADKGGDSAPWTKDNFDPDRAYRLVENLRTELAATKGDKTALTQRLQAAESKFDQFTQGLGGLLGFEAPETDPAKLQAKVTDLSTQIQAKDGDLTKAQADLKAKDITIAVLSNPAARVANTKNLLNNEDFKNSIASVEPTDEAAITAAITKALQANAALKATPSRSGSGEHQGATVQSLEAQLAAATEKKNWSETIRLKQAIAAARQRTAQA